MINIIRSNIHLKVFLGNKDDKTLYCKSIYTAWKSYSLVLKIDQINEALLESLHLGFTYRIVADTGAKDFSVEDSLSKEEVEFLKKEYETKDAQPSFYWIKQDNKITFYLPRVINVERLDGGFVQRAKQPTDLSIEELGLAHVEKEYYPTWA